MLSIVLEVSVRLRGSLTYFLLKRHEIYKYCFANKGQVDVWIIGRDPVQEVKRKRDHFRKVYEFLYRKGPEKRYRHGVSLWCTTERCDDRGSMQEIRERLGMQVEPPMRLVKDAVLNDVMVSGATETNAERNREEAEEVELKRLKCEEEKDEVRLRRLDTLSKLLRCYVKEMSQHGMEYERVKKIQECTKDCNSIVNEVFLDKFGLSEGEFQKVGCYCHCN